MTHLVEILLLGAATVVLFVYGVAQRHLMKSVTAEVEKNRTKIANAEARHEDRLTSFQADIAKSQSLLEEAQSQKAEVVAEIADLKQQKRKLQEYLATEDGRAAVKAAQDELAQVQQEIRNLIREREERRALKPGNVVATVPYADGLKVPPSLLALLPECERVWKQDPGTVLKVTSGAGTWTGTTSSSLIAYAESYASHSWKGGGTCILSVAA